MSMLSSIWLGLLMAAIAVINASLMAWLWRFPMKPDPSGRDPHGVSTAPRLWVNVHRTLGHLFPLTHPLPRAPRPVRPRPPRRLPRSPLLGQRPPHPRLSLRPHLPRAPLRNGPAPL